MDSPPGAMAGDGGVAFPVSQDIREKFRYHRPVRYLVPFAALLVLSGCATVRPITETAGYPAQTPIGPTLDIQVFREGTQIRFTNTTSHAFGETTMWINRWYRARLEPLGPGEYVELPLREFKDRYGEPFRAGGFFAIQRADRLAVAELQVPAAGDQPDTILPLVVVGGGEE
jgi:hypothetical protein